MDNDLYVVQQAPLGRLKGILLDVLSDEDAKTISAMVIGTANEVSDAALGLPTDNAPECLTCGAKSSKDGAKVSKDCEGHYGLINLPFTILNPYFMSEVAQILNKICPGCKSLRLNKKANSSSSHSQPKSCRYCNGRYRDGYPKIKFKVSSKDVFAKTAIIAEVDEKSLNKSSNKVLASDYWDIIPKESAHESSVLSSNKRVLLPAQVYNILKDVCPKNLEALTHRNKSIFLNSLLVTPNSHRVREYGQRISFDETTRMYKRIVDFRGTANDLSARVLQRYKASKIYSEKVSNIELTYEKLSTNDGASSSSGLKNFKELLIGKRTSNCFRLVVVGDPKLKVDEIGLPKQIAENMLISENIYPWNWNKLEPCCDYMFSRKGQFSVSRNGQRVCIEYKEKLQTGDSIRRPLIDGDIVLINRPPSIHQHSLIALSVKILPINSVVSINPLTCSPLRGDFDGDCLHGFVPQSVNSRVELKELVSLNKQLVNGQNGQNLLSFSQDSLTAAYLILADGVCLSKPEMQQLQMYGSCLPILPTIIKSTSTRTSFWTGKQLFSMLLPMDFEFSYPSNGVCIRKGELVSSLHGTSWLRDSGENLFQCLLKHYGEKVLDFLYAAQEVFCEWLSRRGLSVSLLDLCLSSDPQSRKDLQDDIYFGLKEAEKLSDISLLMVDQNQRFLLESSDEDEKMLNYMKDQLRVAQKTSAELCNASLSASKSGYRDMQNLVYKYAGNNNSLLAMLKAGSKGNLQKLFQHSMCLGLQNSLTPLSYSIPHYLSCTSWNNKKSHSCFYKCDATKEAYSYIPCAVVASSYLSGLNPLECFVHSLTARDGSFSGQADVSGTITRRLMFFMRDLIIGYDGTVRNCYGNQIVQFNYCSEDMVGTPSDAQMGGHPVGSLAACAISEVAYSALDQPVSALESSPLIGLKKVLECGVKKKSGSKSASLYLSRRLGRWANGFECGALEVKNYLEAVLFSDVVSEVTISMSTENSTNISPWVCHFHINKDVAKKKRLEMESVISSLHMNCNSTGVKVKLNIPKLQIKNKVCSEANVNGNSNSIFCISVAVDLDDESHRKFGVLEYLRDVVIPILLQTVIKGCREFKKVDILWKDESSCSSSSKSSSGELFLRVIMSKHCERTKFWGILKEKCLRISNIIDWDRSHPDDVHDYSEAFGIDMAWQFFVHSLDSAICKTGKNILPEHLIITANCLSVTGEFVPLNPKGLSNQRKGANICSPFAQASFSDPGESLVKAAKMRQKDNLQGSVDALVWGQTPPIGSGCQFDIVYNKKGHEPAEPTDVYSLLSSKFDKFKSNEKIKLPVKPMPDNAVSKWKFMKQNGRKSLLTGMISKHSAIDEVNKISRILQRMLQEYPMDCQLNGEDKSTAIRALQFHPRWEEKTKSDAVEIKVGRNPNHEDTRCFVLVRTDGTEEDISYRKCINRAMELANPQNLRDYHSKW